MDTFQTEPQVQESGDRRGWHHPAIRGDKANDRRRVVRERPSSLLNLAIIDCVFNNTQHIPSHHARQNSIDWSDLELTQTSILVERQSAYNYPE